VVSDPETRNPLLTRKLDRPSNLFRAPVIALSQEVIRRSLLQPHPQLAKACRKTLGSTPGLTRAGDLAG
jgi:hypothetical protein